jgi:hypothetical protein
VSRAYSNDERVQRAVCQALSQLMSLPRPTLLKISATVLPALAHLSLKPDPTLSMPAARAFFSFLNDTPNVKLLMAITDKVTLPNTSLAWV